MFKIDESAIKTEYFIKIPYYSEKDFTVFLRRNSNLLSVRNFTINEVIV